MDLKQIRCFVAAYEEGSFSKAAKREHCTQPGLSVYIQRLEIMLGHKLFVRKARGVSATIAGRNFYACCAEVLKSLKSVKQRVQEMKGTVACEINIGISPSLFKGAVPWMLSSYLAEHPFVDVRLAEAYSGTLIDWVVSGEVEAALVTKPPQNLGLETTHFFRDRLVLVRRAERKAEAKQRPRRRSCSDLENMDLILPSPRHNLRQVMESAVRLRTTGQSKVLEIDGMLGTFDLIRNSSWATVVSSVAVKDEVKHGNLIAEPIFKPELWLDFYLVHTKDTLLSAPCRDFLEQLKQVLEQRRG
jgi:DNA-binding transcriptional LysR family regulator